MVSNAKIKVKANNEQQDIESKKKFFDKKIR